MVFKEKYISPERCEEIDNMNITCPWSSDVLKLSEKNRKYITNEDESIIYGTAFVPSPFDLACDYGKNYKDYYFMIVGNEYFLHALRQIDYKKETIDGVLHVCNTYELPDDEKINKREDKEYILDLLNFLSVHHSYCGDTEIARQILIYNGKKYTGEGIGEFSE